MTHKAVSTMPTSGIAKFEKKIGIESLKICHFVILTVILTGHMNG